MCESVTCVLDSCINPSSLLQRRSSHRLALLKAAVPPTHQQPCLRGRASTNPPDTQPSPWPTRHSLVGGGGRPAARARVGGAPPGGHTPRHVAALVSRPASTAAASRSALRCSAAPSSAGRPPPPPPPRLPKSGTSQPPKAGIAGQAGASPAAMRPRTAPGGAPRLVELVRGCAREAQAGGRGSCGEEVGGRGVAGRESAKEGG
ncbi:hypothetical protein I4F81_007613 [Pyropia yezoensis]|uniref:Uncharacterized protein n=1 Tax=Pyropia yezoensis TaxID=2788 RepID=A0ACC3C5D9_PYRYE|nr:hypothetical protein I4F81_007613 [Neopyropia yezoensis]